MRALPPTSDERIAYRYVGGGFVMGIPARDLTTSDLRNLDRAAIDACGLYTKITAPKVAPRPTTAGEASA